MKKIYLKVFLVIFILCFLLTTLSNASYTTVSMSIIEEPTSTITIGTNSYVERSIISKDLNNKEIDYQLSITNNELALKPSGELMIILDNSNSMSENITTTQTKKELVINSARTFIEDLLYENDNLKIGIVSFSSKSVTDEGTIDDAKLVSDLSNDAASLISAISNMELAGPKTNLDAGITLAKQYFTSNTDKDHKYVIILTDGVPNIAINDTVPYYSDSIIEKTKQNLLSLGDISDNVFTVLTGISNGSIVANSDSLKTYDDIIAEIFGTIATPTIGKFYYVSYDQLEDTITDTIYKKLLPTQISFKNLKLVDTFSKEIVDNFTFTLVKNPDYGIVSESVDTSTNSITWDIPELKSGETAIVKYKLKLKENYSSEIIDKVINTHDQLSITYTDNSNITDTKTSTITPKIKLTEPVVETPKTVTPTETKVYPKTGISQTIFIFGIFIISAIIFGFKYNKFKNI